jgi:hypothetical protein
MTEGGFREAIEAGVRFHRRAYASGEPGQMMQKFIDKRGAGK